MSSRRQLSRTECLQILTDSLSQLGQQFGVRSIAIFGSVARDEARRYSDVDILVDFESPPSLFTLIRLENWLSKRLGVRVDAVMSDSAKPSFLRRIAQDVVPVHSWRSS